LGYKGTGGIVHHDDISSGGEGFQALQHRVLTLGTAGNWREAFAKILFQENPASESRECIRRNNRLDKRDCPVLLESPE
jgi:hypothetical protein